MLFILLHKEEEDAAKAETEEKKIIDPSGDGVTERAAKNIIEYCITFHYFTFTPQA